MTGHESPKRTYCQRWKLPLILLAILATCVGGLFGLRQLAQYQMYCYARNHLASQIEEVKTGSRVVLYSVDPRFIDMIFAEPECVEQVEELAFIGRVDVADERLGQLKVLPNVRQLYFYTSCGTDTFFENIVGMKSLERVDFHATDLSEDGIGHLAEFPNLRSLSLSGAEVSEPVTRRLKDLRALEELTLFHTTISDSELEQLKDLPQLRELDLTRAEIPSGGAEELQKALPDCKIVRRSI